MCSSLYVCILLNDVVTSFVNRTNLVYKFFNKLIDFLYMFWANMCLSIGENTVPMRYLVFVTLCE